MVMITGFILLTASAAAAYVGLIVRQQYRRQHGLPVRFNLGLGPPPARRTSKGGRHRAREHAAPMQSWDGNTGPIPLAEIAMQTSRFRRSSC